MLIGIEIIDPESAPAPESESGFSYDAATDAYMLNIDELDLNRTASKESHQERLSAISIACQR